MKNIIVDRKKKAASTRYAAVFIYAASEGQGHIVPALTAGKRYRDIRLPSETGRRCRELVEARYMSREWTNIKGRAYKLFTLTKKGEKLALRTI